jgi:hypothetical protein
MIAAAGKFPGDNCWQISAQWTGHHDRGQLSKSAVAARQEKTTMTRKKRSRTPAVIANGLQELQTAVKKIAQHATSAVRDRSVVSPSPPPGDEKLSFRDSTRGETAATPCCQQILQRIVFELALINLLYSDNQAIALQTLRRKSSGSCSAPETSAEEMAPPPSSSEPTGPGLLRFMNPVQDLGRSFFGFLLGGTAGPPAGTPTTPSVTANSDNNNRKPVAASRKRDSVISTTSLSGGGGRTRPPGHPANPSSHSTPILIRRTKPDGAPVLSSSGVQAHSLGRHSLE